MHCVTAITELIWTFSGFGFSRNVGSFGTLFLKREIGGCRRCRVWLEGASPRVSGLHRHQRSLLKPKLFEISTAGTAGTRNNELISTELFFYFNYRIIFLLIIL